MDDEWDLVDPVDILTKLPSDFQEMVASRKWQERKAGLEDLLTLSTDNIRLDPKANYNEIVDTLSKILAKDANINVCAIAAKCITQLAKGLRTEFGPHVSTFTPIIFEKFKEKKPLLRDPLIEAIDALYAATTIDALCDDIVAALGKPNPNIKIQANQFLYRVFKSFNPQNAPKKVVATLTPLIAKCTGASDQETREASFAALVAIMIALGKSNAMTMLEVLIDKERIKKFCNDVVEEAKEEDERAAAQPTSAPAESKASVASEDTIYLTKLLANVQEVVASKKCQERKDALDGLLTSATDNIRLAPIVENLSKILIFLTEDDEKESQDNKASSKWFEIMSNEKFADLVIISSDKAEISSHRNVLSKCSPIFADLIDKATESPCTIICENFDAETIRAALDFCYDKVDAIDGNGAAVYHFALHYDIKELIDACCSLFMNSVNSTNVLDYVQVAYDQNCEEFKKKCLKILSDKKNEIDMKDLPKEIIIDVCSLLKSTS